MNMTHYMQLLSENQPWNLLIFMGIPVILAETLAITELYVLFTRRFNGKVFLLNRLAGLSVGLYFIGVIFYLLVNAVYPITKAGEWRTIIDVVAVSTYLLGGLPLIWIALQELRLVNKGLDQVQKLKIHSMCVAIFLVFGHVAMITGMLDPSLLQGNNSVNGHMSDHEMNMPLKELNKEHPEMHHMHMMPSNPMDIQDRRTQVNLPAYMKSHVLANMRDHLQTVSSISEALGRGQFDLASQLAEDRLGMSSLKMHGASENAPYMPDGMKALGTNMHQSASRFAIDAQNAAVTGDLKPVLISLHVVTESCVACHASYRL